MKKTVLVSCLALLAASPVFAASAPEEGFYLGAAYGTAKLDDKAFRDQQPLSVDDKDSSLQLWGGYRFTKWIAMEGRYATLGEYKAVIYDGDSGTTDSKIKADSFTVNMKVILPIGNSGFDVYGLLGLGIANWDAEVGPVDPKPALSASDIEGAVTYGLGVRWTILPSLTVQLALDGNTYEGSTAVSYTDPDDEDSQITEAISFDSNTLSTTLGIQYNF